MNANNDKPTIVNNLIEYVTQKDKYFFNYLIDDDIKKIIESFDYAYNNVHNAENFSYTEWQTMETDKIAREYLSPMETDLRKFKLIFTTLMMYDKNYKGSDLEYIFQKVASQNFVIVFGPKKWKENKITFGSCPFQNIRAVALNDRDFAAMQKVQGLLNNETLFKGKELKATCAHFTEYENLGMEATTELNFKNLGIKVAPKPSIAENKIGKIIEKADKESAVLIFPELLIDENSDTDINKYLKSTNNLKLVVKGSRYVAKNGHYTNTAYCSVKVGNTWHKDACSYDKRIPFTMGYTEAVANAYKIDTGKYKLDKSELLVEDIVVDDSITVLPYKDCIVGVAICRDVLDLLDKNNPLHRYCDFVDLMLVISENNGDTNMFVGTAECMARWHNCATLYTNALHEAGKGNKLDPYLEMSFALYPFKTTNPADKSKYKRSSTSVSGVITYAAQGGYRIDEENNPIFSILNSKGIKYEQLNEEDKRYGCKVYTFKTE